MDAQPRTKSPGASAGRGVLQPERLALVFDGDPVDYILGKDGGGISAEVVHETAGQDVFVHKHIGRPKYEDFTLSTTLPLDPALHAWIAEAWTGHSTRHDVSVLTLDTQNIIRSQEDFFNTLVSETTFPALDAASKDAARMTIKFAPEYTRMAKASGKAEIPQNKGAQKKWLASNFRLEIDGLDCTRVNRVESFTVKQSIARDEVGEQREFSQLPARLDFPNLQVSLAEAFAKTWLDWHMDFVIKGNNDSSKEKSGRLTFLAPDLKTTLGAVRFFGLGIFKLTPDKVEAGSENIRRVKAELYAERMEFE